MAAKQSLRDKTVWVTGASKGIGLALAKELSKRGAKLALTARTKSDLEGVHSQVPGSCLFVGDVTDPIRMKEIAIQIEQQLGPIEVLIANAGTHIPTDPIAFDSYEYINLMNVNYAGLLNCISAVLPYMLQRKSGRIVGLSSMAGYRGMPTAAAYGASKSAISTFLEGARFHLLEKNIETTVVFPGFVKTPLTDKNQFHMPFLIQPEKAATIICNGIEKGKSEISFPRPFNWIMKLMRIVPLPLYNLIISKVWKRAFPR